MKSSEELQRVRKTNLMKEFPTKMIILRFIHTMTMIILSSEPFIRLHLVELSSSLSSSLLSSSLSLSPILYAAAEVDSSFHEKDTSKQSKKKGEETNSKENEKQSIKEENETHKTDEIEDDIEDPEKDKKYEPLKPELQKILDFPPKRFCEIRKFFPFVFYGQNKYKQYMLFLRHKEIDIKKFKEVSSEEIEEFMRYLSVFIFGRYDRNPDAKIVIILDADRLSLSQVVFGGGARVIKAVLKGLNSTIQYFGVRVEKAVIINAKPSFEKIINMIKVLLPKQVQIQVHGEGKNIRGILKELGDDNLPAEFGGSGVSLRESMTDKDMTVITQQQIMKAYK